MSASHPTDSVDHLVRMANSIGDFFSGYDDEAEAIDGLATHLRRYWEPRMRRGIYAHLDKAQGDGLQELVIKTLKARREQLEPATASA